MRHESKLTHLVTLSKEFRRHLNPRGYLENLIVRCPLPISSGYEFENLYVPVSGEPDSGVTTVMYAGKLCKAIMRVTVKIEGEYTTDEVEAAFDYEQDFIRVYLDYLYERTAQ